MNIRTPGLLRAFSICTLLHGLGCSGEPDKEGPRVGPPPFDGSPTAPCGQYDVCWRGGTATRWASPKCCASEGLETSDAVICLAQLHAIPEGDCIVRGPRQGLYEVISIQEVFEDDCGPSAIYGTVASVDLSDPDYILFGEYRAQVSGNCD